MGVGQFGKWELIINYPWVLILNKGPFNNYVDKMRVRRKSKMYVYNINFKHDLYYCT